jgi:hypothetical protein
MVIRPMRSTLGLGGSQRRAEQRHGLGGHGGAAVGMHRQRSWGDGRLRVGLIQPSLRQGRAVARGHHPAHHLAAEAVQHPLQGAVGPLDWSQPCRDVPGPDLMRRSRPPLWCLRDGRPELGAAFTDCIRVGHEARPRTHGTAVDALVAYGGRHLGRGLGHTALRVQALQDRAACRGRSGARHRQGAAGRRGPHPAGQCCHGRPQLGAPGGQGRRRYARAPSQGPTLAGLCPGVSRRPDTPRVCGSESPAHRLLKHLWIGQNGSRRHTLLGPLCMDCFPRACGCGCHRLFQQRCCTSPPCILQSFPMGQVSHVYWHRGKFFKRYDLSMSKATRSRRRAAGESVVHYTRFGRDFIVMATKGDGPFFEHEAETFRDLRKYPIRFSGYWVGYCQSRVDGSWHPRVTIDPETFAGRKKYFESIAV